MKLRLICFLVCFYAVSMLYSTSFHAIQNGYWDNPDTWNMGGLIPGENDDVNINAGVYVWIDDDSHCNNLDIFGSLVCVDYANVTLIVNGGLFLSTSFGVGGVLDKGNGTFDIRHRYDIYIGSNSRYTPSSSLFLGAIDNVYANIIQNPGGIINTTFATNNYDNLLYRITGNLSLEYNGVRSTFYQCRIIPYQNICISGCIFNFANIDDQLQNRNVSFENCHFVTSVVNCNSVISGAVAILDNGNVFKNLSVINGGSVWGNVSSASNLFVTGNLTVNNGAGISWGNNGTLNVNLGGNLTLGDLITFNVNNVYFDGGRLPENPQVIEAYNTLSSNFINQGSSLAINTTLIFLPGTTYNFNAGTIHLSSNVIRNVNLTNATVSAVNNGGLSSCTIASSTFLNSVALRNTVIKNNSVEFQDDVFINDSFRGANDLTIAVTCDSNVFVRDAQLSPGDFGEFNVNIKGDLEITRSNISTSGINFVGVGEQLFRWNNQTVFNTDIDAACPNLLVAPFYDGSLDLYAPLALTGRTLSAATGTHLIINNPFELSDANLDNIVFDNASNPHAGLTIGSVGITQCVFNLPVTIKSSTIVHDSFTTFADLTVNSTFRGESAASITTSVNNLTLRNGTICPGINGSLTLDVYGSTFDVMQDEGQVTIFAPTYTYFRNMGLTQINCSVPFNSIMYVPGTGSVQLLSNLNMCDKTITLNGVQSFDLNHYTLRNAYLHEGQYHDGGITDCFPAFTIFSNVYFFGQLEFGSSGIIFEGIIENNGIFRGVYGFETDFTVTGRFYNLGSILPGTYGSMKGYFYSDIANYNPDPEQWNCNVFLQGNDARNLDILDITGEVVSDSGAVFSLTGINRLPGITIRNGSTITIPALSELQMSGIDDWYTGDLIVYGTFVNSRQPINIQRDFYNLEVLPSANYPDAQYLRVQYTNGGPYHLAEAVQQYWTMTTATPDSVMTGDMTFHYPVLRNDGRPSSYYQLYISNNSGATWTLFSGTQTCDLMNGIVSAQNVPFNAMYALSTVLINWKNDAAITPLESGVKLAPSFEWNPVSGGTFYRVNIATDTMMENIVHQSDWLENTTYQIPASLNPDTEYYWTISATSTYLGNVVSYSRGFSTRTAITSNLPATADGTSAAPVIFYIPAFVQNLLPGETLTITPYNSDHLFCSYEDGQLSISSAPNWGGTEIITVEITDGSTLLSKEIEVSIVDTLQYLIIVKSLEPDMNIRLSWNYAGGATHYIIYAADTPNGSFEQIAWTEDFFINLDSLQQVRFFRVTAKNGPLPD